MAESTSVAELKKTLALACRVLANQGLADWLGNLSVRHPDGERIIISPRGQAIGGLYAFTADDMLIIDLDGRRLEGPHPVPNEVFIHTEVLRARPDVQSVIHTHQPYSVAFGLSGRPLQAAYVIGSELFERPVPVYDSPNLVNTAEKGRRLAASLGDHPLLLLRGHGVVVTGASVEQAAHNAILMEHQAAYSFRALQLGDLKLMSPQEVQQHREDMAYAASSAAPVGPWRYYTSLLRQG